MIKSKKSKDETVSNQAIETRLNIVIDLLESLPKCICDELEKRKEFFNYSKNDYNKWTLKQEDFDKFKNKISEKISKGYNRDKNE